eukprot:6214287-Pleurochrysis_carterae.AAC.2
MSSKVARPVHSPARSRTERNSAPSAAVFSAKPKSPQAAGGSARTRAQRPATSPSPRARQEKQTAAARDTKRRASSSPGRESARCRLDLDQADAMEQGPTAAKINALLASLSGSSKPKGSLGTDSITEANMDLAKKSMQASNFVARNAPEFPAEAKKGPMVSGKRQLQRDVSGPLQADGRSMAKSANVDIVADVRHLATAECYDAEETEGESDTERVILSGSDKVRDHDVSLPESGVRQASRQLHPEAGELEESGSRTAAQGLRASSMSKKSLRKIAGLVSILVLLFCLLIANVPTVWMDTSGTTGGDTAASKHAKAAQSAPGPSGPGPGAGMNDVATRAHETWNGIMRRAASGVEAVTGGKMADDAGEKDELAGVHAYVRTMEEKSGKGGKVARNSKGGKKESRAVGEQSSSSSPHDGPAPWRQVRNGFAALGSKLAQRRE